MMMIASNTILMNGGGGGCGGEEEEEEEEDIDKGCTGGGIHRCWESQIFPRTGTWAA